MTERRLIKIGGIVQGVGFRPFVHNLATRHRLGGFVRNHSAELVIEVEGAPAALDCFLDELLHRPPSLAQIDCVSFHRLASAGDRAFRIEASDTGRWSGQVFISPDVATCPECLCELFDPHDRRFGYPFLNCTNCGPRLTIVTGAPYDRVRTTMAEFSLCEACREEYGDPQDRRFHAQPTACAACGPNLRLTGPAGDPIDSADPLFAFADALRAGSIGAMKGLGGYHLVCDASNEAAVRELRRRKQRDEKPFAIMVADIECAEAVCHVSAPERELLESWRSPIVLLWKRDSESEPRLTSPVGDHNEGKRARPIADAVAPGNPYLGVMLPYTPLHHLLLRQLGGMPLVMTSGNRSDEPIAYCDAEAFERLRGIADVFLVHNRPIHVRCDDSVTRIVDGVESPVRRSRGYAPQPIPLPFECPAPILAVGGQLKATFAIGSKDRAFLSHHLGDLDDYEAYRAFERDIALYERLFDIQPVVIAHDQHPDYASTRYAEARSGGNRCRNAASGDPPWTGPEPSPFPRRLAIQHHHAHLASCMAEHGLTEPVIGVVFDGSGFGTDGAIWGGEFLIGDYGRFQRAAHLRYVGLPGGEQAIREPWRMAASHLFDAECDHVDLASRIPQITLRTVEKMLTRRWNTPLTSSMGRLFDAVAAIAGIRDRVSYEGQAAMELEWLAAGTAADGAYPFELMDAGESDHLTPKLVVDTRPLIRAVASDARNATDPRIIARRFHSTLVELAAAVCTRVREATGLTTVVLSGGVFMNALLTRETAARLNEERFAVFRHRRVPPNDGGLSLGQLAVAAHQGNLPTQDLDRPRMETAGKDGRD